MIIRPHKNRRLEDFLQSDFVYMIRFFVFILCAFVIGGCMIAVATHQWPGLKPLLTVCGVCAAGFIVIVYLAFLMFKER